MIYRQTEKIEKRLEDVQIKLSKSDYVGVNPEWLLKHLENLSRRLDQVEYKLRQEAERRTDEM